MESSSFLTEFLIILVSATFVASIFMRFKIPTLVGYLIAGIALGPHGLGLITNSETTHQFAEMGVVLLMLTIGLEFSFDRLRGLRTMAIIGGSLQLLVSIILGLGFAYLKKWSFYEGVFLGSVIALSSTAIVFKFLIDRGSTDTPHGRIAVAILLFQDLAVVPLIILIKGLSPHGGPWMMGFGTALIKAVILLGGIFVVARYILPHVLHQFAVRRNQEIFFLVSVVFILGTAWLSEKLGLSYAIGAFFAGVMFANTEYGYEILGEVIPFRHIFVSVFFVSIGLLFDVSFAIQNFWFILGVVGLVLVVNIFVSTLLILGFGYPPRVALATGIILSQIGEFSFIIIETARETGGIDHFIYQVLLSTTFLTMSFTPVLFALVPYVFRFFDKHPLLDIQPKHWKKADKKIEALKNHVILCGYGEIGKDLANTFQLEKIPFLVIDIHPGKTKLARTEGVNVIYGDAGNIEVMKRAHIEKASVVVLSFADSIGTAQIVRVASQLNPDVVLVVRTRYERDIPKLYELGADVVILEQWEVDYQLHRVVLNHFKIPSVRITHHLDRITQKKELLIEKKILKQLGS